MRLKEYWVAGLLAGAATSVCAQVMPLNQAATLFGVRESAWQADLSPSGRKVVFLSAGPGSITIAKILDLETKKVSSIFASPRQARVTRVV